MANGRLGSAKLTPISAALLYSNTSGSQAVINVQATALSSTTNANMALAIDSATVSLNQTTTATSIPSGSMSQLVYNLDTLSSNRPLRYELFSPYNESNSTAFPASYWDGSAWFKPSTGFYGAPNMQKIDPYFISTPSAYGKSQAELPIIWRYNTTSSSMRLRYYNVGSMTGAQFANTQQFADPGTSYTGTQDLPYAGFGWSVDPYTNYLVSVADNGFMQSLQLAGSASNTGSYTSPNVIYNFMGGGSLTSYPHYWYAPRIMGSNGMFIMQPTGYTNSYFAIGDIELATSLGNSGYAYYWSATPATAAWWYTAAPSNTDQHVGWFEYNPNDQRWYFEYIGTSGRSIYSFTRTSLLALSTRGNSTTFNLASFCTSHGAGPWGGNYITRPLRVGASLWWAYSNNGNAYTSTDLKTWTLATTYYPSLGYAANTFNLASVSSTSYNFVQASTANVSRFSSGYANVSQTAVLEFNTSISNYQRTGVLLSNGDKLYAQNYGSVDFSATVMGYEG